MKCLEREKLFAYRHRLLDGREEGAVRGHLAECGRCRAALDEYRRLDTVLEEWKAVEPRPGFDARLRAALERSARAPASSLRGLGWGPIWSFGSLRWLAPALAMVVVVSVVALRVRRSRPTPGSAVATVAQPVAPTAGVGAPTEANADEEELRLYKNLSILEDYDMLADFDVLSELPKSAGD